MAYTNHLQHFTEKIQEQTGKKTIDRILQNAAVLIREINEQARSEINEPAIEEHPIETREFERIFQQLCSYLDGGNVIKNYVKYVKSKQKEDANLKAKRKELSTR